MDRGSKEVELLLRGRAVLFRPEFLKTGKQKRAKMVEVKIMGERTLKGSSRN